MVRREHVEHAAADGEEVFLRSLELEDVGNDVSVRLFDAFGAACRSVKSCQILCSKKLLSNTNPEEYMRYAVWSTISGPYDSFGSGAIVLPISTSP